ncbi:MAG: hypothetical protein COV99_11730 [Bacteroidetes bacterium CG12_big_fil_rev_8_21_14_0_65_60_17]|nr:MAG: hypothetical protein COV99_11730 [Bacteroidetes bacterium CG12_big_fil_rev_8_21_14_0_65_60_17]
METIEIALTPLVFVSGMSLFLLVLTNRFTTLTSRAQEFITNWVRDANDARGRRFARRHPERIEKLAARIDILKASIFFAATSIAVSLAASGLILFFSTSARELKELMLVVALSALTSVVLFLVDIMRAASNTRADLKDLADMVHEGGTDTQESASSLENVSP